MLDKMIIGRYVPANSLMHKMDPRAKLLLVFLFVCVVFLANNVVSYGLLAVFTILLISLSKIPLRYLYNGLKPIFFLIVFTFLLHILFTKEGELLFEYGWFEIYEGGLIQGFFISIRFTLLILVTSLLTLTTSPISITDGMEELLGPLKKWKMPVHELALMMSIALRFIPTLMEETEKIMKAQTARGVDFSSGPIKDRVKSIVPLLVPLFVSSFKRAEELATAMESRGYRGGEGRTKYRQLNWKTSDSLLMVSIGVLTVMLFLLRS
ncbi:energy-coupling factor transporter transmembrane component T family protein [Peribacillus castrilensis]|jgi:energy-coupling factor transport system permease protein|uniref:Energy-coupling factor transporter transmembrane protein EcfT n=1 Tax=Peribacillus frigoritolerans TaxID=450367 RepID=A0AAJ1QIP1_9BACI|nr:MULTISPECIES: energy-coupling factor transporter transmembrane protein EcfT [Bacillaceae]KOR81389.1 cobalt ABC transporter permease [Bacillus sp. FJAT-21352]KOR84926.1 cobalt ABC transporter permease [Bacillus sp. FJAT-22058]MBD8138428.1 energy-coupling factor transporter transmembrane protein EcfT [Bacillus sp. CFBP 13597]MCD1163351.1 energy-coupling factor transporter transmembrane protein EcfT [Peribacillus castrilensis]MCP1096216.1 energy-coupling factor transporter transmembrane protei